MVVEALQGLQRSVGDIGSRVAAVEHRLPPAEPSTSRPSLPGVAAGLRADRAAGDASWDLPGPSTPRPPTQDPVYTLETAGRPVARGECFMPPEAAVSSTLRQQIKMGKDINLVKLVITSEATGKLVDCDDVSILIKTNECAS